MGVIAIFTNKKHMFPKGHRASVANDWISWIAGGGNGVGVFLVAQHGLGDGPRGVGAQRSERSEGGSGDLAWL